MGAMKQPKKKFKVETMTNEASSEELAMIDMGDKADSRGDGGRPVYAGLK